MALIAVFGPSLCGFPYGDIGYGVQADYTLGLMSFAQDFEHSARADVPVRTGYLQSSICSIDGGDRVYAGAGADYAQYVEYGTWKMAAQPFFESAVMWAADAAYGLWYAELDHCMSEALLLAEEYGEELRLLKRDEGDLLRAEMYALGDERYAEIIEECEAHCDEMMVEGADPIAIEEYRAMMYALAEQTRAEYYAIGDELQAQCYAEGDHIYDVIVSEQEMYNAYYEMSVAPDDPYVMIV